MQPSARRQVTGHTPSRANGRTVGGVISVPSGESGPAKALFVYA